MCISYIIQNVLNVNLAPECFIFGIRNKPRAECEVRFSASRGVEEAYLEEGHGNLRCSWMI